MRVASSSKKLGEILMKLGFLTQEQLDEVLAEQNTGAERFGDILLRKGYVSEEILFAVLGRQFGINYVSLAELGELPPDVIALVPERLAKTYTLIPIEFNASSRTLTVAMSDPLDIVAIDNLKLITKCSIETVVARRKEILEHIERYYGKKDTLEEAEKQAESVFETGEADVVDESETDTLDMDRAADSAPVVKAVNYIIEQAIMRNASDILIDPQEKAVRIRYRLDGVLHDQKPFPKKLLSPMVTRIKIMAKMDITERRKPQDGRIKMSYSGKQINLRVSTLPASHGERVAIRIIDSAAVQLKLSDLGFEENQLKAYQYAIEQPYGMILVTGPTGSGKTTTLYSALTLLNDPGENLMTVEEPVEVVIYGINQVNVNERAGLTFAAALRAFLRQDPDTIMVGEIRDKETVEIAINAALTGHLVFSTLHTNDAASTITRLLNMNIEPFLLSSTLTLVVSQKLVRKICKHCREAYVVPVEQLMPLGLTAQMAGGASEVTIYRGRGCAKCNGGYSGRSGVYETLLISDAIRELILKRASHFDIKRAAREAGMLTLREAALKKLLSGTTTVEEVVKATFADEVV